MGDLHLDIVLNRIRDEYKVDATLGKLQVAYREAPSTIAVINGETDIRITDRIVFPTRASDTNNSRLYLAN